MAGQADGSIIVDTEINPEGFKAGSSELLAAIKSLSSEVKELGRILKETFSNNSQSIGGTESSVQHLEATIASLKEEVQSLQSKVAELQERLNNLGNSKEPQTPVDGIATAAQNADGQIAALEAKVKGLESTIASLQTQLENVTETPTEANIDINEAESKIAALETRIQELEAELSSAQSGQATPAPQADLSGPVQSASALQRSIDSVSNSVTNLEPTFQKAMSGSESAMTSFQTKAGALETKIATLREKLEAMGNTKTPTAEYKALSAETERTGVKLENLLNRQERMQAMGVKENSAQWKTLQYDLDLAAQKYDQLAAAKARMETSGTAFTVGSQTAEYSQMVSQINAAESALSSMQAQAARVEVRANGIGAAFRRVGTAIGTAAKTVCGALLNGLKAVLSTTKKLIVGNKNYKKSFRGITYIIKRVGLGLLGCRGVYMILRKAVSAYMEANQGLADQLSSCWTSLGNLLGPLITKIINLVATAISYVTAFLKLLGMTGSAAGDAVNSAGGAAKDAQKALAGFDEINRMQDDSSGGGGNSTTPLPEATLPDWTQQMIDQIKAGNWAGAATTLANELNAMVKSIDWAGIGEKIGYYFNGALEFLATAILTFDWVSLGSSLATSLNRIITNVDWGNLAVVFAAKLIILLETLTGFFETLDGAEFGNAIHEFITGGINAVDWVGATGHLAKAISDFIMAINFGQIGIDLSNGFRTILNSITSSITNFDWKDLGSKISDFINGIDWGGIIADTATMVGEVLSGALDLLIGFAEDLDWAKLGSDLWNGLIGVITNIDWGGIVSKAFELLGAAVGGAATLVAEFCVHLWESIKAGFESMKETYFAPYMNELGELTIEGFFQGIWDMLCDIGTWIKENIFDPFINGFKSVFGIHSPSTVMEELGGFLIEGLLKGITLAWGSITKFFNDALSSLTLTFRSSLYDSNVGCALIDAMSNMEDETNRSSVGIKSIVSDALDAVKSTISTQLSNAKSAASTAWESMKSTASTTGSLIKSAASGDWATVKSTITTQLSNAKSAASTAWNSIKSTATTTGSNIKFTVSSAWDSVKSSISSKLSSAKSAASTTWSSIKSTATSVNSSIKSTLSTTWDNIKSTLSTKLSGISSSMSSTFGTLKSNASTWGKHICENLASGVKNSVSTVGSAVTTVANKIKSLLGFSEPEDGPLSNFHTYMPDMIDLMTYGIKSNQDKAIGAVSDMASAISEEIQNGEYAMNGEYSVNGAGVESSLGNFSDKIADSFTNLMDRLQAIAQSVTFATPAILNGAVPYSAATSAERTSGGGSSDNFTEFSSDVDERLADLSYQLKQILAVLKALNLNIDLDALADAITQQQRSKLRNFGGV